METDNSITVEVAYALPKEQVIIKIQVPQEATVQQAIDASAILSRFPEIDLGEHKVGVFGKLCKLDRKLLQGDRVEIYRPLIADPKEVRRQRAAQGKATKKGVREG